MQPISSPIPSTGPGALLKGAAQPPDGSAARSAFSAQPVAAHPSEAPQARCRRVLIVDDEPYIRSFCLYTLEAEGCRCDQAGNGVLALQAARTVPYDLVLLDIDMPEMSGKEALRPLRQVCPSPNLKIIMFSGGASCNDMAQMLSDGADDYLAKPFSAVELCGRVKAALRLKEAQDRSELLNQRLAESYKALEIRVQERTAELLQAKELVKQAHAENERLLGSISSVLIGLDKDCRITRWNKVAEDLFGLRAGEAFGKRLGDAGIHWEYRSIIGRVEECIARVQQARIENIPFVRSDGKHRFLGLSITPILNGVGTAAGLLLLGADVTERRLLETQLVHAQKLESIGQLAAGVAHEINTPIQYIGDNTKFLQDAFADLDRVVHVYGRLAAAVQHGQPTADLVGEVQTAIAQADLDYLHEEIPKAIQQSLSGVGSVAKIVRAMKEFSHPGGEEKTAIDINHAIENTITVARNEWKYVAEIVRDFHPSLPPVPCLPGELNQVVLNLIINAAHAIGDRVEAEPGGKGTITLSTSQRGREVEIRIADTGCGIPEAIRSRIFDPFFTTKPVGKGTGQGLAIAHSVVVKKHGGTLHFETEVNRGTTFIIRLPL